MPSKSFLHTAIQAIQNAEIFYIDENLSIVAHTKQWFARFTNALKISANNELINTNIKLYLEQEVADRLTKNLEVTAHSNISSTINVPAEDLLFIWSISPWIYQLENTKHIGYCITQNERAYDRSISHSPQLEQKTIDFILESVYDGYWDWYIQENYEYMSPRFWQMFGYNPGEKKMDPKEWMDIIFPEDLKKALELFDAHIKSKGEVAYYLEARYRHKDGHVVYVICKGHVITWNSDGTPNRMIGTHTDVTELRNVQQDNIRLQLDKEKFQDISQMKSRLLATLSHEIRTPLHGMMGMASILEGKLSDSTHKSYATSLLENCDRLLTVLNDVLQMCKLDNFSAVMIPTENHMDSFLNGIIGLFMLKAKEKNNSLLYEIDLCYGDSEFDVVVFDKNRTCQVLINLINNAIKFTKEGTIKLRCWGSDLQVINGKNIGSLNFSVTDSGIGISEECISTIFEPFTQVENDITRRYEGSGLGLSICKGIADNILQATLEVTSTLMDGSCFTLSIPSCEFVSSTQRVVSNKTTQVKQKIFQQMNPKWEKAFFEAHQERITPISVLIVDDNKMNRIILKKIIKGYSAFAVGCISKVDEAVNGKVAVEKFNTNPYSVVFMDLHMPVMDGFEATLTIRQLEKSNSKQPALIAAVTADSFVSTKNQSLECGVNIFLSKPFKKEQIFHLLTQTCLKP